MHHTYVSLWYRILPVVSKNSWALLLIEMCLVSVFSCKLGVRSVFSSMPALSFHPAALMAWPLVYIPSDESESCARFKNCHALKLCKTLLLTKAVRRNPPARGFTSSKEQRLSGLPFSIKLIKVAIFERGPMSFVKFPVSLSSFSVPWLVDRCSAAACSPAVPLWNQASARDGGQLCAPPICPTLTLLSSSLFRLRMTSVLDIVTQVPNLPAANAFGRQPKGQTNRAEQRTSDSVSFQNMIG